MMNEYIAFSVEQVGHSKQSQRLEILSLSPCSRSKYKFLLTESGRSPSQ